ncbi:ABC transporter ATP-binding protein [uncultured Streptomyces sp.]|uniref:ABC transporter ATP-binding protein n=1 Tax=uncultured Streptomyces sp. TaxID=174707 RepID=UPI002616BF34|nr:ATP-binding cassette domain-containing protein [uncultured Streptomyces sp.]
MTSIEVHQLTKTYGGQRAVNNLHFRVEPGKVTGFLGPNGAGKSTTLRLLLGIDRPTGGTATIGGRAYATLDAPLRQVGALLDARSAHGSRTARDHLAILATSNGIATSRVDTVLEETGLLAVGAKRIKSFSLGMRQRLGIAAALLGDPAVILLDEPANGLDPEGIIWVRTLLRRLASERRTVLVSSHLMNETASYADHLVVLGKGKLLADMPMGEFLDRHTRPRVSLRSAEAGRLHDLLTGRGHQPELRGEDGLSVDGVRAEEVGRMAGGAGIVLLELRDEQASLEEAYLELTATAGEYTSLSNPRPDRRPGA